MDVTFQVMELMEYVKKIMKSMMLKIEFPCSFVFSYIY